MNISQMFAMGGYGVYVWTAYFITLSVFAVNFILVICERQRIRKMKEKVQKCSDSYRL